MGIDVEDLTRQWNAAWLGCPPLGHSLRAYFPERWVRFHSLPGSRRYPEDEDDYAVILHRHHTVLGELAATGTFLVTVQYPPRDLATRSQPETVGLHPGAMRWMTVANPDDPDFGPVDAYVSRHRYSPGSLDSLLRHVAGAQAAEVIVADTAMTWLYHPYDGGADVIAPSANDRDRLRHRHQDWLSAHPGGL